MAYVKLKEKAILLRRQGLSYNEIGKKIGAPKSTLSGWLKSVALKKKDRERLYTKQIDYLSYGAQSQKERRKRQVEAIISQAEKEIKSPLSEDAFKMMGAALYWAEGSKGKRAQVTNSDPRLVLFITEWIKNILGVSSSKLKARLNIYSQQNEKEIIRFWSGLLKIPTANFGKSYIKPAGKDYRKNNLYFGTIRIEVPKSADLLCRINGWINGAMRAYDPRTDKIKKRWAHLLKTNRPVNIKKEPR